MAALRAHPGLALGNAIGSNIYNIAGVLGITALITPIAVDPVFLSFDLWIMMIAALSIVPFVLFRLKITRVVGLVFLIAYAAYIYKVVDLGRNNPIDHSSLKVSTSRI
jgi:cation:H+ antiporter